ncbi:sacsin N-terminal ATP-binding-like domain-containing protein [Sutcliffiella horikoshii]|uniref:sacsin N-terminal ATP-binding-like domain-containing protein n=1 Tax=Sutcliffiella horikoshii TaxID=79883 RepID=UPI003CFA8337
MSNWRTVDELRNIFIEKYTSSKLSNELEKACSEEYELMRDYNGRQILELLQNVDDAYGDKKKSGNLNGNEEEVEVKITYKDNVLEVSNTGTSFTKETIERLCLGRASNKSSQNIGNKGTGFRSLLNDAEWIELYSGDFAIRFSEDFAKSCFEKYSHIELINEQLMSWKKDYPLCFPTMNCPEQIEMVVSDFDTLIRVKLKERNHLKENGVTKQLKQPFYKSLLFLPNITKITIDTDEETRRTEKLIDGMDVLIERTVDGTCKPAEEYFVFKKDVEIDDKTAVLSIAVPKDSNYDFKKEKLHCYFPIRDFSTPINALINAPFITNNSRDGVPNDSEGINKKIFGEVLPFIKEVAEKLAKPKYADTAIKMVTPIQDNKLWDSDEFNFHDEYLGLLSDAMILPTVNGEYISIQDEPKLLINGFPTEFKGEKFNLLLQLSTEESVEIVTLLSEFVDYDGLDFSVDDLARRINLINDKWDISTRIKVFIWWSNHYRDTDFVPNLLMDSRNSWILKSNKVFLPTDGGISVLPNELEWVKLCVLRQDYVDELISQIKDDYGDEWKKLNDKYSAERTGDKRLLDAFSEDYLAVEFTEQSSSDLIIGTINRQIDHEEKAKSFMNWFFENYRDRLTQGSELSKVPFNLPNENGDIKASTKLFLGVNYGNPLGDKIFANTTYSALMEPNKLYQGNDIDEFTAFIEKCGVAKFPLIDTKSLINDKEFKNFIANKYSDEIDFNINYLTTMSIENIEDLIRNLNTSDIVEWVTNDEKLRELLYSNRKHSNATQQSNRHGVNFNSNEYIKYVLNTTPWIQFDDHKYSPQQVVKYDKLKANVHGLYGISEQDLLEVVKRDLIQNLDFKDSMALLEDFEIKRILDTLPTFDKGEISRKLYTEIIKFKRDKEPTYSPKDILVLAKNGKFYLSNDLKYADKKLPKIMENQEHFISIPVKQNISTINKWLGVERFRTNLELFSFIKVDYSLENFKQEIDEIKTAVLSTIDDNKTNVDKIKRMQILPCSEIVAIDKEQNNRQVHLEDFYFVDDGRDFYLKLPSSEQSIEQLRLSDGFSNAIVDIFKQLLTIELDANLIELIVSKDATRKREKISDEFGVDKWNDSYQMLFSENAINRMVFDYFSENGASTNTLNQLENVDFSYFLRVSDYETVISSLKEINKDISDLNSLSELINIDVREFWQKKVRQYLDEHQQEFVDKLYSKLFSEGDMEKQNRFLVEVDEYKDYSADLDSIKNSVKFDLAQAVYKFFPILEDVIEKIDVKTTYKENYNKLNPDNLFTDEIANNQKVQIMIYFNRVDEFKSWLIMLQKQVEKEQSLKSKDTYKKLEGVVPEKQEIEFRESKGLPSTNKKRHNWAYTKSAEEKANNAKKIVGNKGELLIYNLLCKQYGIENVFPNSEAFVEIGILKPGQASSGKYDLSYKDKHGKTFFVEVKTGDGKSFIITPGELEFAKQNPDQLILYLVSEIDSNKPKYQEVPPRFWEDDQFRLKEVVERIDVEF